MTSEQKEIKRLHQELMILAERVACFIEALDRAMMMPPTEQRGKTIARWSNELDMANDRALHFVLKLSFAQMQSLKKKWFAKRSPPKSKTDPCL